MKESRGSRFCQSHPAKDQTQLPQSGGHLTDFIAGESSPPPRGEGGPFNTHPSAPWGGALRGLGRNSVQDRGLRGRSGQAGVGLLLFQSESVSLELPPPWCSAWFLGSEEPEPRSQNHEEQEE